jgi:hypothetical protein
MSPTHETQSMREIRLLRRRLLRKGGGLTGMVQVPGKMFMVLCYLSPVQVLSMIYIKKESLNIYGQQFLQYQQNRHLPLTSYHLT